MKLLIAASTLLICYSGAAFAAGEERLTTRVYAVADLVVDGPTDNSWLLRYFELTQKAVSAQLMAKPGQHADPPKIGTVQANLDDLAEVIQSTLLSFDGTKVTPHKRTRSLVVRATSATHDEIVELLESLRQASEISVEFRIEAIVPDEKSDDSDIQQASASESTPPNPTFAESWITRHGRDLAAEDARRFRQEIKEHGLRIVPLTGGTIRSGYSLDCYSDKLAAIVTATASIDRRHVRTILTRYLGESMLVSSSLQIPNGHSMIQHLALGDETALPCLITARVIVPKETEEVVRPEDALH